MVTQPSALSQKESQALVPLETDVVSGHLFFSRRIELPVGLEESEVPGVVELELDKLSPFPIEHLHFGYLVDAASRFVCIYASYKKRIESERSKSWQKLDWATTDYAIGLLATSDSRKPLILATPDSLVCLQYDDQSELPRAFRAKLRELGEEANSLDSQIAIFADELSLSGVTIRKWEILPQVSQTGQDLILEATDLDSDRRFVQRVPRSRSWSMDIRDNEVISRVQAENRRNFILWKIVLGLAALLVLLIVGELAFGGAVAYRNLREQWNEDDKPQVEEIRSMQATIDELNNFKESDLVPFEMLTAMIPFQDRETIIYDRVETDGINSLVVDGQANNISVRNTFKTKLESFEKISSVEILNSRNTQKGTEFSVLVTFVPGAITNE